MRFLQLSTGVLLLPTGKVEREEGFILSYASV